MSAPGSTDAPFVNSAASVSSTAAGAQAGNTSMPQLAQPEGLGNMGPDLADEGNKILAQMEERVKEKQSIVQDKANELQELEQRLQAAEQRKAELEAQAQQV